MNRHTWQVALLIVTIISLAVVIIVLLQVIFSPYVHGGPARIVTENAGPYPLKVTFYADPANAGYALPFAIQSMERANGPLSYDVSARLATGRPGSVVHGDVGRGPATAEGIPRSVNVTTRGNWTLHIVVMGSSGQGVASIPFSATALPAIPAWFAWLIGLIPLYGMMIFLLMQRGARSAESGSREKIDTNG